MVGLVWGEPFETLMASLSVVELELAGQTFAGLSGDIGLQRLASTHFDAQGVRNADSLTGGPT